MGYQLIAITTDRPSRMRESVNKHSVTYQVLSDSAMTTAAAFGIAFRVPSETRKIYEGYGIDLVGAAGMDHGILPVPSVFLVGTDGVIQFQYVNPNHRVRLESTVLLAAARAMMERDSD